MPSRAMSNEASSNPFVGNRGLSFEERFLPRVRVVRNKWGCWEWTGPLKDDGYPGWIWLNGEQMRVHRASYQYFIRFYNRELTIDHLCNNRKCVHPNHLEPVTHLTNVHRAAARRERCNRGHLWSENVTFYGNRKSRRCRACNYERTLLRRARLRSLGLKIT